MDVSLLVNFKMDGTAATYRLRDGLSDPNHNELISKMNKCPCSK